MLCQHAHNHGDAVLIVLTCPCCVLQPATMEAALADAFPEANRLLKHTPGLDADLSGSTGIVAVSVTASDSETGCSSRCRQQLLS